MRLAISIFLVTVTILSLGVLADAHVSSVSPEELRSLLTAIGSSSVPNYKLPLFDCRDKWIGEVIGYRGSNTDYEFVFAHGELVGIGLGDYLHRVMVTSKVLARETLTNHFGDKAAVSDIHLTYVNPVSFWARIFYSYGGKILNDLYLQGGSLRFTLAECRTQDLDQENGRFQKSASFPAETFAWFEIQHDFPFWEYYLSGLSNAVVTLADYWKSKGFIKMPIYPDDPDFFLTNVRLMMQDVEMLRRKCACENTEVGVSEILEKFINARGGSVKVTVKDKFLKNEQNKVVLSSQELEGILRQGNQPLLFECRGGSLTSYGILTGYLKTREGFFMSCLLPMQPIEGVRWERYFLNWAVVRDFRIYEISAESGE